MNAATVKREIPTPLHVATIDKNVMFVKVILEIQPKMAFSPYNKDLPIYHAVMNNSLEIVKLLGVYMKDPLAPKPSGITTLIRALFFRRYEVVKFLIHFVDDLSNFVRISGYEMMTFEHPDQDQWKMFHLLASTTKYDPVQCNWILNQSIKKGKFEVVKALLQNVTDPLNLCYFAGEDPIDICYRFKPKGYEQMVEYFKRFEKSGIRKQ